MQARKRNTSHKAVDRRTSKKCKWDKGHLVKSELQKLAPQSDRCAVPRIPPESPGNSELLGFVKEHLPPGKGAGAPAQLEAAGRPLGHPTAVGDTCPAKTEDSLALPAHTSGWGTASQQLLSTGRVHTAHRAGRKASTADGGQHLSGQGQQPDLPPASSSCPSMSKQEFRKMHFRAKDDEDDDDGAEM
ncbi:unnamed protein product [Nyctereutes procyonoides]|uniref:(raccoon dog) hypothetical protein n=1 Tax=Nyctereutes procyonoides TaxID=34880 RepID=A0A811Y810_NYCPR|nr:unnamed protein product [Nyctereutes procyonoides]